MRLLRPAAYTLFLLSCWTQSVWAQSFQDPLSRTGRSGALSDVSFMPLFLIPIAIALAFVIVFLVMRRVRGKNGSMRDILKAREWPTAMTRRDGRVLEVNQAMLDAVPRKTAILDMLQPLLGASPGDIYRMSRLGLSDGIAMNTHSLAENGEPVVLCVNLAGSDQLVWQVIPKSRMGALFSDDGALQFESAPFGYIRFGAMGEITTNDLFRDVFSEDAITLLEEQVEAGVFSAGRILLPGADGIERLALSALRIDRSNDVDTCEIFLFIPDGETSGQVSAAETLEAIPVSLLHLDIEGRVFWGNAQAREMLGRSFRVGRMLGDIMQPLSRSLDSLLAEVRQEEQSGSGEMVRLKDGGFESFAQVSLTHMVLQGQPSMMAVLTDASELRMLEDKFAQSQKMEAVGKLAGGVAHDFNNVLTAISGNCDLLLLRKDASHPDFNDLTQIKQNSNRAVTLVRQLLAFSRKQTLQPKLLSVQDVVSDTLYLLDRLIGENITLSLDHGRDLGSVRADHQQLEQAIMNLVVNARDAMPDGGSIVIATENKRIIEDEKHLGVSVPPGDYIVISVSDNGTGIDPQVMDKVFDPFFTTKAVGEGTGLGLSTVYGIVKQSGGYIYAENQETGGARFTILLPRAYPSYGDTTPAEETPDVAKPDLTGHGAVLLVEDEAPVRSFASRALKLRGYRVIEAESAEDAMVVLSEGAEDVDVLVSDVVMPGMDGPTFASKARELRPDLRVIFISGYAEDSFRRNLTDLQFEFLPKPFSLNELTAKVKNAIEGSGPRV
ncbi:MAG: ATP-binding protein [Pseudomonadota bacterium]